MNNENPNTSLPSNSEAPVCEHISQPRSHTTDSPAGDTIGTSNVLSDILTGNHTAANNIPTNNTTKPTNPFPAQSPDLNSNGITTEFTGSIPCNSTNQNPNLSPDQTPDLNPNFTPDQNSVDISGSIPHSSTSATSDWSPQSEQTTASGEEVPQAPMAANSDPTVIRPADSPQGNQSPPGNMPGQASPSSERNFLVRTNDPDNPVLRVEIIADHLAPGMQIDFFSIVGLIGGGGMGRVYKARDTRLDRFVALKVLTPAQNMENDNRERFVIEAQASAKLHHENIACVYYFGEYKGLPYLAMEYVEGVNIRQLVERGGPLSVEDTISYTIQITAALEQIARNRIVHRDIKPSNILLTDDGTVKVIDLGLAKQLTPATELTATGVTLGTFDYISPEQAKDPRTVDIRSDIYSLGCTVYYMLTGQPPFPSKTQLQKLLAHQSESPISISEFRSDIPDRFIDVLNGMMAKNVFLRYQSPQQLMKALVSVAEEMGMRPQGVSTTRWHLPAASRIRIWKEHLWWLAPIIILVVVVMSLDSIWRVTKFEEECLPQGGLSQNWEENNADIQTIEPQLESPSGSRAPDNAGTLRPSLQSEPGLSSQSPMPEPGNGLGNGLGNGHETNPASGLIHAPKDGSGPATVPINNPSLQFNPLQQGQTVTTPAGQQWETSSGPNGGIGTEPVGSIPGGSIPPDVDRIPR